MLSEVMPASVSEGLAHIMDTVTEVAEADFGLEFDPTLVRGMSYYTGTIFEVSMEGFGGSVAGGGRYDKMIGKFTGMETPRDSICCTNCSYQDGSGSRMPPPISSPSWISYVAAESSVP